MSLEQRKVLADLWGELRKAGGQTAPISTAGHGLQLVVGRGKFAWRASMYWSNSKFGNVMYFCIHPRRLAVEGHGLKCKQWLKAWSVEFGARDAEERSSEESVQDAVRFGFDFESGLMFLTQFVETMTNFNVSVFRRWDKLPTTELQALDSASSESLAADDQTDVASPLTAADGASEGELINPTTVNPWAESIAEMVRNARGAAAESGAIRTHEVKTKVYGFAEGQLEHHLETLITAQGGLCKLTGIRLHFIGQSGGEHIDEHRLASLDRIDSDGDYVERNLQIVCRFVNKCKGTYSQHDFCGHLALVRSISAQ